MSKPWLSIPRAAGKWRIVLLTPLLFLALTCSSQGITLQPGTDSLTHIFREIERQTHRYHVGYSPETLRGMPMVTLRLPPNVGYKRVLSASFAGLMLRFFESD